jgi:hypothetical protein
MYAYQELVYMQIMYDLIDGTVVVDRRFYRESIQDEHVQIRIEL